MFLAKAVVVAGERLEQFELDGVVIEGRGAEIGGDAVERGAGEAGFGVEVDVSFGVGGHDEGDGAIEAADAEVGTHEDFGVGKVVVVGGGDGEVRSAAARLKGKTGRERGENRPV